jgi:hypothetical protein
VEAGKRARDQWGVALVEPLENKKHEDFAKAVVAGYSARDAYELAGFEGGVGTRNRYAKKLLAHPEIKKRIAELRQIELVLANATPQRTVYEYVQIAYANMAYILKHYKETGELPEEYSAAISRFRKSTHPTRNGPKDEVDIQIEKLKALEKIAEWQGLTGPLVRGGTGSGSGYALEGEPDHFLTQEQKREGMKELLAQIEGHAEQEAAEEEGRQATYNKWYEDTTAFRAWAEKSSSREAHEEDPSETAEDTRPEQP